MKKHIDRRMASIKAFGEGDDHTFEFVANSGGLDRWGEILDAKGCDYENWMMNPVGLWAHDDWSLPIFRGLELGVENEELVGVGEFASKLYPFAALVEDMYREEFLSGLSVRFLPNAWETYEEGTDERNAGIRRRYTDWELLEISVVDIPCDPKALRKAYDAGDQDGLRNMIKSATMLGEGPASPEPGATLRRYDDKLVDPRTIEYAKSIEPATFETFEECAGAMARLLRGGGADLPGSARKSYFDDLAVEYARFERPVPEFKTYG
ncbi:hypothetical protein KAW64_10965, partial [bacterium]|nr:hypothetical protein [bacterium]